MSMSKIEMMERALDTLTAWAATSEGEDAAHMLTGHIQPGLITAAEKSSERSLFVKCLRAAFLVGCTWATQEDPGENAAPMTAPELRDDGEEPLPF